MILNDNSQLYSDMKTLILLSGLAHDLGKLNQLFQEKIKEGAIRKDSVRHEWISMVILIKLFEGEGLDDIVSQINERAIDFNSGSATQGVYLFSRDIASMQDAIVFAVATHHKLPSSEKLNHITRNDHVCFNEGDQHPYIKLRLDDDLVALILEMVHKVKRDIEPRYKDRSLSFFQAVAFEIRKYLILADQEFSAKAKPAEHYDGSKAYANTIERDDGVKALNQDLNYHLKGVAHLAVSKFKAAQRDKAPRFSAPTLEAFNTDTNHPDFIWQNQAAQHLRGQPDGCHLIFNLAGTGAGKTIGNVRIKCAISGSRKAAIILNLRSLTTQTKKDIRQFQGVNTKDIAMVLGHSIQKIMSEREDKVLGDEDADSEQDLLIHGGSQGDSVARYLNFYFEKHPHIKTLLNSPLTISTADWLVAAGDLSRKHHHILANIVLSLSDLIIDEVDGYEGRSLLSILRLVELAGRYKKNVIVSSASLNTPTSEALYQAYSKGLNSGFLNPSPLICTVVHNKDTPASKAFSPSADLEEFKAFYHEKVMSIVAKEMNNEKIASKASLDEPTESQFLEAVSRSIGRLHKTNYTFDPKSGKNISFALVRIANISTVEKVTKYLDKDEIEGLDHYVTPYHSSILGIHRFMLEQDLDVILTRKSKDDFKRAIDHPDIKSRIEKSDSDNICFIVVATPVEEVGRDHDFDFAVIEPSSTQSIIQTIGRVNRHRRNKKEHPNFAILQFPFRRCREESSPPYFVKPGLEVLGRRGSTHPSADIDKLFPRQEIKSIGLRERISENIAFSVADDKGIRLLTRDYLEVLLLKNHMWMSKTYYSKTRLREASPTLDLVYSPEKETFIASSASYDRGREEETHIPSDDYVFNRPFFHYQLEDLIDKAHEMDLSPQVSFRVSIPYNESVTPASFAAKRILYSSYLGIIRRNGE